MIQIFTDGSVTEYSRSEGGYAAIIVTDDGFVDFVYGYDPETTNNRMEMSAVIWSIEYLMNEGVTDDIYIYSDSEYVVKGMTGWIFYWKKNNLIDQRANSDLWKEMLSLISQAQPKVEWVKAHNGNKYNELADKVANLARLQKNDEIEKLKREY